MRKSILSTVFLAVAGMATIAATQPAALANEDHAAAIRHDVVPQVRSWLADSKVISAVNSQNARHSGLSQGDVDRLDKQWRAETASNSRKLIDGVLSNPLSGYLGNVKNEAAGLYTEIFVMDNKGLNVGQSDVTSDYWQGDEDKWQKTYLAGTDAVFIDDVEFDESTQTFQAQLSLPIVDPATGESIGAATVGVNVEMLQ
jgi:hypothetical protein